MNILKIGLLSLAMLLVFGYVAAQETADTAEAEIAEAVALDEEVTAEDLGVSEPNLLPDSPFYFLKNWGRTVQTVFAFDPVRKAELKEKFANEKLVEVKKMVKQNKNREKIEKAVQNYENEVKEMARATEKIRERAEENEQVGQFLDKFIQQQILHQRILQKLETQVPAETFEKIAEARETHIEKFGEVMTRLENKENIQQRLETNLRQVKGSEYKELKNLEVLKALAEKVPEATKEAIKGAQENTLKRLKNQLEEMSTEKLEQFQAYTEIISGAKEKQLEILEDLKESLDEKPALQRKIIEVKDNVMEQIRVRTQGMNCPEVAKPVVGFCQDGKIRINKDEKSCITSYECLPLETKGEQACTTQFDPVCGKDGKTYSNSCFAKISGVEVAYGGGCKKKCSNEGESCGGIAGIVCCSGLTCEYVGDYPDAGGKCVKEEENEASGIRKQMEETQRQLQQLQEQLNLQ